MGRKPKIKVEPLVSNQLLDALKFLSLVTKTTGAPFETHVLLSNKCAIASNGIISAGIQIEENLTCCPQNKLIIEALSKCKNEFKISQINENRIIVQNDKFKATIPCIPIDSINNVIPDGNNFIINDNFKLALEKIEILAEEGAQKVHLASVLMYNKSVIATNGSIIFEYWHGIDLPTNLTLPKSFVKTLINCKKKLVGFGSSQSSATFWFDDNSWLKTQIFAEKWPDVSGVLNKECDPKPIVGNFWEAFEAVAPFSEGDVFFKEIVISSNGNVDRNIKQGLCSHNTEGLGAQYELPGLPTNLTFSIKNLSLLKGLVKSIDWCTKEGHLMFFGDNIRGIIAGRK